MTDSMSDYPLRDTGQAVIAPAAQPWYDSMTLPLAVEVAAEMVDEWDYESDPHGYCHERSVLLRLVEAVRSVCTCPQGRDDFDYGKAGSHHNPDRCLLWRDLP